MPADFVGMARIDAARRLLEDQQPLQRIALSYGFSKPDAIHRAFLLGSAPVPANTARAFPMDVGVVRLA